VEYAILVGFIAVVAAAAVYGLGQIVELMYRAGRGAFG
jgi:Flp pilus assembly pilin Flp